MSGLFFIFDCQANNNRGWCTSWCGVLRVGHNFVSFVSFRILFGSLITCFGVLMWDWCRAVMTYTCSYSYSMIPFIYLIILDFLPIYQKGCPATHRAEQWWFCILFKCASVRPPHVYAALYFSHCVECHSQRTHCLKTQGAWLPTVPH